MEEKPEGYRKEINVILPVESAHCDLDSLCQL